MSEWRAHVVALYGAGCTVREIGGVLGVGCGRVRRELLAAGVQMRPRGRRPRGASAEAVRAAEMRSAGVPLRVVSAILGRSEAATRRLARAGSDGAA